MSSRPAYLYVVATPIGNLADITQRALDVLRSVEVILSENVGKTRRLLGHYGIATKVLSYREENARRMGEVALGLLAAGKSVALVAEAGTPGVSDPGRQLVDAAWARDFKVVPIPGASAAIAAVSVCGMADARFVFEGFLPRRRSKRRQRLRELAGDPRQTVLFEAPHRLVECLEDIRDSLGERICVVAREVTKLHEEIERAGVSWFIEKYSARKPLGEFVIICEGCREAVAEGRGCGAAVLALDARESGVPSRMGAADSGAALDAALREALALVRGGLRKKAAAKMVSKKYRLRSSDVYTAIRLAAPHEKKEVGKKKARP